MGLFSKFLKGDKKETEIKEIKEEKIEKKVETGMGKKYKAVIACGSGIATSTMARNKIEKGFQEKGIALEITQCKIGELEGMAKSLKPDFVVHTVVLPKDLEFDCPVFSGVPFLTGVGMKKTLDEIVEAIQK